MIASPLGLYSHIRANRIRTVWLFILLFLSVYAAVYFAILIWLYLFAEGALLNLGVMRGSSLQSLIIKTNNYFRDNFLLITSVLFLWIGNVALLGEKLFSVMADFRVVTRIEFPKLYNTMENLCVTSGMPMPTIGIVQSSQRNAFAIGFLQKQQTVVVTTGLLVALSDEEVETVLAHELTHIYNDDVMIMTIASSLINIVSIIAETSKKRLVKLYNKKEVVLSSGNKQERHKVYENNEENHITQIQNELINRNLNFSLYISFSIGWLILGMYTYQDIKRTGFEDYKISIISYVILYFILRILNAEKKDEYATYGILFIFTAPGWFLTSLSNLSLSRTREYLADAGAVELTKNPDALIRALLKIKGMSDLPKLSTPIMQMCIENPRHNMWDLFSTHPSIEDRIEAIIAYAGGRSDLSPTKFHVESLQSSLAAMRLEEKRVKEENKGKRKIFGRRRK